MNLTEEKFGHESNQGDLVLITGAAGGLGSAFAVECAKRGWGMLLTDLRKEELGKLASRLEAQYGIHAITHACDLTDANARSILFTRCRKERLTFRMLLNVAGLDHEGLFYEQPRQFIQQIIRLNVEATMDMTHEMLKLRNPLAPFRIVTVASLAAFYPMPVKATYAASKRFLLDFSLALREEVKEVGASVTVLCPAGLPTTPETIRSIASQGLMGALTTCAVDGVAAQTLDAAVKGKMIVIPGWINRALRVLGGLVPACCVAKLIGLRWKWTRARKSKIVLASMHNLENQI